jgi:thioredoxin reductase (NADPH)
MPKPVLFALEEDERALADVGRALRRRYGADYRVDCARSPAAALGSLTRMSDAGEDVALVLAGQWLEDTTGGDVLDRVKRLHPHARRGLLVPWGAWADRRTAAAILGSMALGRIDYYVLRPANPADEQFHQAVSGFLYDWSRDRRVAAYAVEVVGDPRSPRTRALREMFARSGIPSTYMSPDSSAGQAVRDRAGPEAKLPVAAFPDGKVLANPTDLELAAATGAPVELERDEFDLVVVGAGPAGLSAAVYGESEGLATLVVDRGGIGGQASSSSLIRNYMGFPRGIGGGDLAARAYQQAWVFGAEFAFMRSVCGLERTGDRLTVTFRDGGRVRSRAVILATGAAYRRLGVPALEDLVGAGVSYGGAAAEAASLRGEHVYVVGGANSSGQAALHLARHAGSVTMVVRAGELGAGMSDYLVREIEAADIQVRLQTAVVGGGGSGRLEHLMLRHGPSGDEEIVDASALFVLIGARPRTEWLPNQVARDTQGFVMTGNDALASGAWPLEREPLRLESSMPGVFCAGDARQGSVKRVAASVGEGSIAIQSVHRLFVADRLSPAQSPVSR